MRKIITGLIILGFCSLTSAVLVAAHPWENIPLTVSAEIAGRRTSSYHGVPIQIDEIYYTAPTSFEGQSTRIFGYFCAPLNTGKKLPGLMLVHGGGGFADLDRSLYFASKGYANLAIDLPGKGLNREISRSSGIDMTVPNLMASDTLNDNFLYHAIAAIRSGITYLSERSEVDRERLGMVGISWGGVLTMITNGVDDRLKSAVNVYASGYLDQGSTWQAWFDNMFSEQRKFWSDNFDPSSYLKTQKAPILFITSTNDQCFYLPNFMRSYHQISAKKAVAIGPNLNHQLSDELRPDIVKWNDYILKGKDEFPSISFLKVEQREQKVVIPIRLKSATPIKEVNFYYSQGILNKWTTRKWKELAAERWQDLYLITVPSAQIKPEIVFYASAVDENNVVSSTPLSSIYRLNANGRQSLVVSYRVEQINFHKTPLRSIAHLLDARTRRLPDLVSFEIERGNKTLILKEKSPEAALLIEGQPPQIIALESPPVFEDEEFMIPMKSVCLAFGAYDFEIKENSYYFTLPEFIKKFEIADILEQAYLFSGLDYKDLDSLAGLFKIEEIQKEQFIFKQAESAAYLYILVQGELEVSTHLSPTKSWRVKKPGYLLSDISILNSEVYHQSAQAKKLTAVIKSSKEDFIEFLAKHPQVAARIIAGLGSKITN